MVFEGYGAAGVAFVVETLTDNKNRTASAVRSTFDKYGGNLGTPGCVSYMFSRKGVITIEKTGDIDGDALMETALDAGMEDMQEYDDSYEIITDPNDFDTVREAIEAAGYVPVESDIENIPDVGSEPADPEDIKNLKKMIEVLEDNDDVQKVYHNSTIPLED